MKEKNNNETQSNWVECENCGLIKNRDGCVPCGCDKNDVE